MRNWLFLIPVLMVVFGCAHQQPPQIAGQRTNNQGVVTEKIIRVETYHPHSALLTPEGPKQYVEITCRYYFQEGNKPEQKFSIGGRGAGPFLNPFLAVSNSRLWVTFSENIIWTNRPEAAHMVNPGPEWGPGAQPRISYQVNDLHIYVFDDKGFFRQRTFMALQKGEVKFMPEGQTYAAEYALKDGNHIVLFKSPSGLKKYDVVSDTVTDADPAEDQWK